jgi:hypothetical protein
MHSPLKNLVIEKHLNLENKVSQKTDENFSL